MVTPWPPMERPLFTRDHWHSKFSLFRQTNYSNDLFQVYVHAIQLHCSEPKVKETLPNEQVTVAYMFILSNKWNFHDFTWNKIFNLENGQMVYRPEL